MSSKFLTVQEAAQLLRVCPDHVYRHIDQLPHVKIGHRIAIDAAKLEKLVAKEAK